MPNVTPRSGQEMIAGKPWLARMIDKARLQATGVLESEFDLEYPCPMDQNLLRELQIDPEVFQTIVLEQKTDDAIVTALKAAHAQLH
jgi:hypothetical protein